MKRVNLALGSGGPLGFAHIGVIKRLIKSGITISGIAGSSAGALVGSMYCLYDNIDKVESITYEFVRDNAFKLFEISNITDRITKETKIKLFLEEIFREKTYSDLKLPLGVATCDLETGKEYDITAGRLLESVFASMSVPGVFGPTFYWGKWLVDGALVNPTPVSLAKRLNGDYTLAVDLTPITPLTFDTKPGQLSVIGRTLDIMMQSVSAEKLNTAKNTYIIYPNFGKKEYTFSEPVARRYINIGYNTMDEHIDKLNKILGE